MTTRHATIAPTTGNLARVGCFRDLVRVVTVDLYANVACEGGGPLHLAHGVRVFDGRPVSWFVTDADARRLGWVKED